MDKIDLNTLILFYDVVNAQSIGKAALQSGVPKATISRRLRQLEKDLGAILLKRGPRRLLMTNVGEVFYEYCERIARDARAAHRAVGQAQVELHGQLRIAMPVVFGSEFVAGAIARFCRLHPGVTVLINATNDWVDVSEAPYDVAIHIGRVRNERLTTRRLAEIDRGVYASPDYCSTRGVPTRPSDLRDHDCIALETQIGDGVWAKSGGDGEGGVDFRATTTDIGVVRALAVAGMGIAILPTMLCRDLVAEGKLTRLLPDWRPPPLIASATFLERRHLSRMIRAFLDLLAEHIEPRLGEE